MRVIKNIEIRTQGFSVHCPRNFPNPIPVPEILFFFISPKMYKGAGSRKNTFQSQIWSFDEFFLNQLKREQFARHASNKLRHSVEYTSSKCSAQVENELKDTFARLEFTAKEVTHDIDDKIQLLDGMVNFKKFYKKIIFFRFLKKFLKKNHNNIVVLLKCRKNGRINLIG